MKGSIHFRKDRGWWFVSWYHKAKGEIKGRNYKINKYKGHILHQTHKEKEKDQGYRNAQKLLSLMQADVERGVFRIEKYTKECLPMLSRTFGNGYMRLKTPSNQGLIKITRIA